LIGFKLNLSGPGSAVTMTALPGAAQRRTEPATCLVVTLMRFQKLIRGDVDDQDRKGRLVVVPGGLVPDLVGYRVRPIASRVAASVSASAARSASVK
jgi:hypothetical protein